MRFILIIYFLSYLFFSCNHSELVKIKESKRFDKEYTDIYYFDTQMNDGEYSIFINDTTINYNSLSNKTKLSKDQARSLVAILKDSSCFNIEGECGTYSDRACFVFYKNNNIIKIITTGCSYSFFSNSPKNWPSKNGSIKEPCDSLRYSKLLKSIWDKIETHTN